MGWANRNDSKGRPIGYAVEATCDHSNCDEPIDRGVGYACGGMHGEADQEHQFGTSCEGYFCFDHLVYRDFRDDDGRVYAIAVCLSCAERNDSE